jgi:hypothetical protein
MKIIFYLLFLQFIFIQCKSQDCNQIPTHFNSYDQALSFVKKAIFQYKDVVNTSRSSWVRGASYFSCVGSTGFFIIKTDSEEYLHSGLPLYLWTQFKNASSFGGFYDRYIKGKYRFNL